MGDVKSLAAALVAVAALALPALAAAARWQLPPVDFVRPPGVTSAARGHATVEAARDRVGNWVFCYQIAFETPQRPYGIFLRRDRVGAPDPAVVKLSTAPHNPLPWDGSMSRSGCARAPATAMRELVRAPGRFYLDIPTPAYPRGELRARLRGPARRLPEP